MCSLAESVSDDPTTARALHVTRLTAEGASPPPPWRAPNTRDLIRVDGVMRRRRSGLVSLRKLRCIRGHRIKTPHAIQDAGVACVHTWRGAECGAMLWV